MKKIFLTMALFVAAFAFSGIPVSAECTGHIWQTVSSSEPACEEAGEKKSECVQCHEIKTELFPALGHDWKEFGSREEPTCTEEGYWQRRCRRCRKEEKVSIPALGHVWEEWAFEEPSCFEEGRRRYNCKRKYCWEEKEVILPAYGGHQWSKWHVLKKSTVYEEGVQRHHCMECGRRVRQSIPKKKPGKADKEVQKELKKFFAAFKKFDTKGISQHFENPHSVVLFSEEWPAIGYVRAKNKKISFKIVGGTVSKKSAVLKVKCRYYSACDAFYRSFERLVEYLTKNPSGSSSAVQYQYQNLSQDGRRYGFMDSQTFTIKLRKKGKEWKIVAPTKALYNIMTCDYASAYKGYFGREYFWQ